MTDAALPALSIIHSDELESPTRRALRRLFQRKGALVLLQFVVVFVFGKILGHGDEFFPNVVPAVQHLLGSRACGKWRLILSLGVYVAAGSEDDEQSNRN